MRQVIFGFVLIFCTNLSAQSVKKADKEFELGNFLSAVTIYQKLAIKEINNGHIANRLGDSFRILNQLEAAEKWYKKALTLSGTGPEVLLNLGKVQKMQGKYDAAESTFDKFALAQPGIGKHFRNTCSFAKQILNTPSPYVVRREYFNNEEDDFCPTPFESHIVFSSTRSLTDNIERPHLMISSLDQNNYLKPPTALRTMFDQTYGEGPASYSSSANLVVFAKNNFKEGVRLIPDSKMNMSLYYAVLDGDGGWNEIQPFPYNGSGYSSSFPSLSADGKTLFFASNRPDGYGGYDIFVSRRIGNTWTSPENLGPKVNTQGNEISPFFDGSTLYFSSDWHNGLGGYDIFKAQRSESNWDRIFHLGSSVNSSGDDFGFVIHPESNISYFSSNRAGGKGKHDIYRAIRQTDEIVFNVKDVNGSPIENAVIDLSACEEGNYRTDNNGIYSFQALGGFACDITISKTGFGEEMIQVVSKGQQKSQTFEVVLNKAPEKLNGSIVNVSNNSPEPEVFVKATNQETGIALETYSDANGSYSLALEPNSVYIIRYSKVGFTDAHNRINTKGTLSSKLLGSINLDPVYATNSNSDKENNATAPSNQSDLAPNGFAVQIAATEMSNKINLNDFEKLSGIGAVYAVGEDGLTKIRVGNFKTKAAANAAKKTIARQGFDQAFIVAKTNEVITSNLNLATATTVSTKTNTKIEKENSTSVNPTINQPSATTYNSLGRIDNKYKVRLATYKNTSYFKPGKILDLGTIEKVKYGELTVMLLSSFDSLYEAKKAMEKVRKAGFTTAHVVLDKDEKLIRQR